MNTRAIFVMVVCLLCLGAAARADYLEVRNNATIKEDPHRDATILFRPEIGDHLRLVDDDQVNGYYLA